MFLCVWLYVISTMCADDCKGHKRASDLPVLDIGDCESSNVGARNQVLCNMSDLCLLPGQEVAE